MGLLNSGEAIFTGGGNPKPKFSSGEAPLGRRTRAKMIAEYLTVASVSRKK